MHLKDGKRVFLKLAECGKNNSQAYAGFVSSYPKGTPKHMNRWGKLVSHMLLDLLPAVLLDGAH